MYMTPVPLYVHACFQLHPQGTAHLKRQAGFKIVTEWPEKEKWPPLYP